MKGEDGRGEEKGVTLGFVIFGWHLVGVCTCTVWSGSVKLGGGRVWMPSTCVRLSDGDVPAIRPPGLRLNDYCAVVSLRAESDQLYLTGLNHGLLGYFLHPRL